MAWQRLVAIVIGQSQAIAIVIGQSQVITIAIGQSQVIAIVIGFGMDNWNKYWPDLCQLRLLLSWQKNLQSICN